MLSYYRPQRSWAKVIFLQACVCPQGGRGVCLSACWDTHHPPRTRHPPQSRPPPDQAHHPPGPGTPPGADPPDQVHPPGSRPPRPPRSRHPPWTRHTPPQTPPPGPGTAQEHPPEADCSIRLTSGRYASYWNAFLSTVLCVIFTYSAAYTLIRRHNFSDLYRIRFC